MDDLSEAKLDELEALAKAATPGPWEYRNEYGVELVNAPGEDVDRSVAVANGDDESDEEHERGCRDMAFIAAARDALPALLAEVRRHRATAPAPSHPVESVPGTRGCVCYRCGLAKSDPSHHEGRAAEVHPFDPRPVFAPAPVVGPKKILRDMSTPESRAFWEAADAAAAEVATWPAWKRAGINVEHQPAPAVESGVEEDGKP